MSVSVVAREWPNFLELGGNVADNLPQPFDKGVDGPVGIVGVVGVVQDTQPGLVFLLCVLGISELLVGLLNGKGDQKGCHLLLFSTVGVGYQPQKIKYFAMARGAPGGDFCGFWPLWLS